jgi:tetratricopeptide (TPR) repeat protein
MAKKDVKLSPKAKKLLEGARTKFSHDPKKAINLLRSANPEDLNMYDRQKIGREILVRLKSAGPGYIDRESIAFVYGLETPQQKYQSQEEGKTGRSYRLLEKRGKAEEDFDNAQFKERHHLFGQAINLYWSAGRKYKESGSIDKALISYEQAVDLLPKNDEYISFNEELMKRELDQLKQIKARKDKLRVSPLEQTAAATAIIGIIGGLLFFSSNLTGNVIGSQDNTNFIGLAFVLMGIIGAFFWMKMR